MEISRESIFAAAQQLLFEKADLDPKMDRLGQTHVFFYARVDAAPPWIENDEQFRFKFLAFYDPKKEEVKIEAVSAWIEDTSAKKPKPMFERTFWPTSNGRLHSKSQMIGEVLKLKNPQQQQMLTIREKFGMANHISKEEIQLPAPGKSSRLRH